MGSTGAASSLPVDEHAERDGMTSVPAMLAFLTQQPQDGEPSRRTPQAQREAIEEQSAGSMTGVVLRSHACGDSNACKGAEDESLELNMQLPAHRRSKIKTPRGAHSEAAAQPPGCSAGTEGWDVEQVSGGHKTLDDRPL